MKTWKLAFWNLEAVPTDLPRFCHPMKVAKAKAGAVHCVRFRLMAWLS